jgi:hypothetical protein
MHKKGRICLDFPLIISVSSYSSHVSTILGFGRVLIVFTCREPDDNFLGREEMIGGISMRRGYGRYRTAFLGYSCILPVRKAHLRRRATGVLSIWTQASPSINPQNNIQYLFFCASWMILSSTNPWHQVGGLVCSVQQRLQLFQEHLLSLFQFAKLHYSYIKVTQTSIAEMVLSKCKVRAEICCHIYRV